MTPLPITRVVLYKHGVGYFERDGRVEGDATLTLTFKQPEVSDVLKSLTVLDLDGGHVASVSYDSTKPLEQLLAEVALTIPDEGSLVGLLPQIKGARVRVHPPRQATMGGFSPPPSSDGVEGALVGVDTQQQKVGDVATRAVYISVLTDQGELRLYDLMALGRLEILDPTLRRDLDFYLRTQLSAKKKDARTFTFFAQGQGSRTIRLSYTLEAPVWKATYRILLGEEGRAPLIQGWAVVDNTQDEDWENVRLSLVAGLPVSFVHDLYTPRYVRRPVVAVQETTGVLPPEVESGMEYEMLGEHEREEVAFSDAMEMPMVVRHKMASEANARGGAGGYGGGRRVGSAPSSMPAQVRERKLGDLFEYEIEHPVTIRRNQSALVPIVQRGFEGRPVLLYNKATRPANPLRAVEFKNTTGLTLEGGPITVIENGSYTGEAMMETTRPADQRLIPYAVELSVRVTDSLDSHQHAVSRVIVRDNTVVTHSLVERQTAYTIDNRGEAEQVLYLDHPREREWALHDSDAPHEVTDNFWRFRLVLPPAKVTRHVVRERRVNARGYNLVDGPKEVIQALIAQRYFDARTEKALRDLGEVQRKDTETLARLNQSEVERKTIDNEQQRIRENLKALGDRPSEKDLRERFVRTLQAQEDRLEQMHQEEKRMKAEREAYQKAAKDLVAQLDYDAEIPQGGRSAAGSQA